MSSLPPINAIGPTNAMPSTSRLSIWGMPLVTSFPSTSVPSVSTPITLVSMPTSRFVFSWGKILGSNGGGGFPPSSGIPIGSPAMPNAKFPFGWNVHVGSGAAPSNAGGSNAFGGYNVPWNSHTLRGMRNLGGNNAFRSAYVPGGTHGPGGSHAFRSFFVPRGNPSGGNNPFGSPYAFGSYNMGISFFQDRSLENKYNIGLHKSLYSIVPDKERENNIKVDEIKLTQTRIKMKNMISLIGMGYIS